jgi:hypothetical protein
MAPRPKSFILVRILQEKRPKPQKVSWVQVPMKMVSLSWKLHDRRMVPKPKALILMRRLQEEATTTKICPGFESQ